jgi:hypothetical protein
MEARASKTWGPKLELGTQRNEEGPVFKPEEY